MTGLNYEFVPVAVGTVCLPLGLVSSLLSSKAAWPAGKLSTSHSKFNYRNDRKFRAP